MEQLTDLKRYFDTFSIDKTKVIEEFKNPINENVFFNNLDLLQTNSDLVLFDNDRWYMRPEVFCKDHYQEPYYYQIVLLVNNIKTIFDFVPDNFVERIIVAPYTKDIIKLISY
ncbi:MAG: hypothetical protein R3250_09415 [Melioribacteraceae bacterium]|nr:hypothetical protein [Melioribacteraceae bacterium]